MLYWQQILNLLQMERMKVSLWRICHTYFDKPVQYESRLILSGLCWMTCSSSLIQWFSMHLTEYEHDGNIPFVCKYWNKCFGTGNPSLKISSLIFMMCSFRITITKSINKHYTSIFFIRNWEGIFTIQYTLHILYFVLWLFIITLFTYNTQI